MELLRPLPFEHWPILRESLKRDWPAYAYYYNWIICIIKWKTRKPSILFDIYCPNGTLESGTFIGIGKDTFYNVVPFTFDKSGDVLRKCLQETQLLNWNDLLFFWFIQEHSRELVQSVLAEKQKIIPKLKVVTVPATFYFKTKEECAAFEIEKIPEEFEVRHLEKSHVPIINSVYPNRDQAHPEWTANQFASALEINRGIGLFRKDDNTLVSWVLHGVFGGLHALQTLPEYQRRGFAKIVLKTLFKEIASEDLDITLFILDGNQASVKLFESLGFKPYGAVQFINTCITN